MLTMMMLSAQDGSGIAAIMADVRLVNSSLVFVSSSSGDTQQANGACHKAGCHFMSAALMAEICERGVSHQVNNTAGVQLVRACIGML